MKEDRFDEMRSTDAALRPNAREGGNLYIGLYVLGLAAIATGVIDLLWGSFDPDHQPIQAWNIADKSAFAYVVGVVLVGGGAAILSRRTARFGAVALGAAYVLFAVFWLPRLYTAPHYLGLSFAVLVGVLAGVFTELIVVGAAVVVYAWATARGATHGTAANVARWLFGLSAIVFGLNHLASVHQSAMTIYVPHWMPFGQPFWVAFTGIAFVLAGIAILVRTLDALASWLLGLMLLTFSAVTLLPGLILEAHRPEGDWGGNAYQIVAVGACWVFAASLTMRRGSTAARQAPGVPVT